MLRIYLAFAAAVFSFVVCIPLSATPTKKPAAPASKTAAAKPQPAKATKPKTASTAKRKPARAAAAQKKAPRTAAARKALSGKSQAKTRSAHARRGKKSQPSRSWKYSQRAPSPERYLEIERALFERGYLSKAPDGKWGPEAETAMRRFQADNQLSGDGKLTSLSLIALGLGPKRPAATASTLMPEGAQVSGDPQP